MKLKKVAGGIPAIVSSLKHINKEAGLYNGFKTLLKLNQKDGFDCPGCAWPDPDDERSALGEYCENGAKAVAEEITRKRTDVDFFKKHSIEELRKWSDYELGKSGRIVQPMVLKPGQSHYEAISWEDAFSTIANELKGLDSPDEAIFYTSGRTSNEAAFLYQLFVREYGTNNLPDCSNMCHESSGVALTDTVGIGKGSSTLNDFNDTDLVISVGHNPGTNHPRMLSALKFAKKRGAKILTVNPFPETGLMNFKHPQSLTDIVGPATSLTDLFLQIRINGDAALFKALLIFMIEHEEKVPNSVFDHEFIKEHTAGLDAMISDLKQQNLDELIAQTGLERKEVEEAAQMIIENKRIIICWSMGITQHKNGVDNIREMVNVLLLKGSIGKPGTGTFPVRGHSNVQGDRTMGIYEKPSNAFLDSIQKVFDFEPPREHGYDVVEAIQAMHQEKAKFFFGMGGNFLMAAPDTEYTAQALKKCNLTVQVSTKLNRSHLETGKTAIILPCIGRAEKDIQKHGPQFISVENSTGIVHKSTGHLAAFSEHLLSEPAIVAKLAMATLGESSKVDWQSMMDNYDLIRDSIEKTIPGFDNYNERVSDPKGFYLPNGSRVRKFNTKNMKANFTVNSVSDISLQNGELLMMTTRSHDQYNTTIYGLEDRYRGISGERNVIMMNKEDIADHGLRDGEMVDIYSNYDNTERVAKNFKVIEHDLPKKCTATYYPESNVLVPVNHFARRSQTPISKSVVVTIKKRS